MKASTRRLLRAAAVAAFLVILWVAWNTVLLYPLKLLVVLLHEVSHGVAAVATGGRIREIAVTADQGGWCDCPGGNAFLTLSAGYLGSLGWGALLVWASTRSGAWERSALTLLGGLLVFLTLGWVRRPLPVALGLGAGLGLLWAAVRAGGRVRTWLLALVGTTSCLYALLDVKSDVLDRPGAPSDAVALAQLTGVPALAWGLLWMAASAAVIWALWRRVWARL